MVWWRMLLVFQRLTGPYVLTPWRSPLLRWRMETYGLYGADGRLLHADRMTPGQFFQFLLRQRRPLCRFLRWAALL